MGMEDSGSMTVAEKRDEVVAERRGKRSLHLQWKATRNQGTRAPRPRPGPERKRNTGKWLEGIKVSSFPHGRTAASEVCVLRWVLLTGICEIEDRVYWLEVLIGKSAAHHRLHPQILCAVPSRIKVPTCLEPGVRMEKYCSDLVPPWEQMPPVPTPALSQEPGRPASTSRF